MTKIILQFADIFTVLPMLMPFESMRMVGAHLQNTDVPFAFLAKEHRWYYLHVG